MEYGLNFPVFKSSVTSRKLTTFLFASTVIFRLLFANIWHICFFAFSHSLLFSKGQPWEKRNSSSNFDVTMGSYDGAETCELVGCYLLSQLKQIPGIKSGLYRDDGLAVLNQTPRQIEKGLLVNPVTP